MVLKAQSASIIGSTKATIWAKKRVLWMCLQRRESRLTDKRSRSDSEAGYTERFVEECSRLGFSRLNVTSTCLQYGNPCMPMR